MTRSQLSETNDVVTYDPEANAYYAQHEWAGDGSLSVTLITALADVMGEDPTSIEPLGTYINPSALDSLFETRNESRAGAAGRLELSIDDYHVTIYADGEIVIRP